MQPNCSWNMLNQLSMPDFELIGAEKHINIKRNIVLVQQWSCAKHLFNWWFCFISNLCIYSYSSTSRPGPQILSLPKLQVGIYKWRDFSPWLTVIICLAPYTYVSPSSKVVPALYWPFLLEEDEGSSHYFDVADSGTLLFFWLPLHFHCGCAPDAYGNEGI